MSSDMFERAVQAQAAKVQTAETHAAVSAATTQAAIAEKLGLSLTELKALELVQEFEALPTGQLGQLMGISWGGTTALINRLEAKGLLRRGKSPSDRRKQTLEQFPLDSLDMVGTLGRGAGVVALLLAPDKVTYRVRPGAYLGQSDGRVTAVYEDRIELVELVPDGAGGWLERPATIALEDN